MTNILINCINVNILCTHVECGGISNNYCLYLWMKEAFMARRDITLTIKATNNYLWEWETMFFLQANPTSSIRLDEGTKKVKMRKLITSNYSTEDGIWLLLLPSMKRGVLLMLDKDVLNMGTGIGEFETTTDGTGDRGGNAGSSTASSSSMSGMTWVAELRTMGPVFRVLPRPYFQ